ncbi:uncharacterized protein LOC126184195 [Schistocerca cancellata]|uniref:uncharacterized protein LOC126184195 n=1 Tax=Schistocerca cancellata TaxID=274614 RepID=UPI002119AFA0|nr:uncharacterized protein LOC126184195 [Schistocerca cancellata]
MEKGPGAVLSASLVLMLVGSGDASLLLPSAGVGPRLRLAQPPEAQPPAATGDSAAAAVPIGVGTAAERWLPLPWSKRQAAEPHRHPDIPTALTEHLFMRSQRGNRQYDVPQIECPPAEDGMERFACPTPDRMGRYRCIDDHVLCDGFIDCPSGEDEDRQACMFYKTTKAHLDVLADALLRWARGR